MDKILETAIANLNKQFGKGTIVNFNEESDRTIQRISSGSIGLDLALGGGWPKGRIVEIYGPESSGKSTLSLHACFEVQKEGGICGYVDAEHAFDDEYAKNLGLDLSNDRFIYSTPDNGEQALTIVEQLVKTGLVSLVIVDSVAALVPKAEIESDFGENKMGLMARLMSQAMRKLVGIISNTNCTVIFINQIRNKIGVMYGSPEVTTGGDALKYYASIRCDVRRIGQNKDGDEVLSNKTRVKVVKNKTFPPFKQAEFDIIFGEGISALDEIIDLASEHEVIRKGGSWFSYGDTKLGQGAENVKILLNDNPELLEKITTELREKLKR